MINCFINDMQDIKDKNEICEIHIKYDDFDVYLTGYVENILNNYFLIKLINNYGYNGYSIFSLRHIIKITRNSKELINIKEIYENKHSEYTVIPHLYDNLFCDLLNYAKENKLVIAIERFNSGSFYKGYVTDFNNKYAKIRELNPYGGYDGDSVIRVKYITQLKCDGIHEKELDMLAKMKDVGKS